MGHHFVKLDWRRFRPVKTTNRKNQGLTQYPRARKTRTMDPARARIL
jgi:hypothetical protein